MRRMLRTTILLGTCICSLAVGLGGQAAALTGAEGYGYRYVSLDDTTPPGFLFVDYFAVTTGRSVYGNAQACDITCDSSLVVYRNGKTTVLHEGNGYAANETGVVGGSIVTDPDTHIEQAALFHGTNVQLIPRLPNEQSSRVLKLSDTGIALVESVDATGRTSFYLLMFGRTVPLNLGTVQPRDLDVSNTGLVSGTTGGISNNDRAFRFRPPSGPQQILDPLPTEPLSWGQAINTRGDVLGYSFVSGGRERIGYWRDTTFVTSFVQGTPQYPTISNQLLWNEVGLIVITRTNDLKSYIVPKPGIRLNLADLTAGPLPLWTEMRDVNNLGDVLGVGGPARGFADHSFLLERSGIPR